MIILLSAYNGEKFIAEQIRTILAQQGVDVMLLVRDDGSTDSTRAIVGEIAAADGRVTLIKGENIGLKASFTLLVQHAVEAYPEERLFAFADQDDVWLPQKLQRAAAMIGQVADQAQPIAYFSNMVQADIDAVPHKMRYERPLPLNAGDCLVSSYAYGCSMVFNRPAAELYAAHPPMANAYHDYWLSLIARFAGELIYDPGSCILYRQHGANCVGAPLEETREQVMRGHAAAWRGSNRQLDIAQAFLQTFGSQIKPELRGYVECYAAYRGSLRRKWRIATSRAFVSLHSLERHTLLRRLSFAVRTFLNKI